MDASTYNCKFLESNSVYLRPFVKEDIPFLLHWSNDAPTRFKIGDTRPTSAAEVESRMDPTRQGRIWLTVVRKSDGKIIGETGLLRMFPDWRTTDLSIIIPDPEDQGKGYGTETINLMMAYAFGNLGFNRISIGVVGFNEPALRFYEKVGFKKEGIQEEGYYCNFQYHDFIMMRILKREFMQLHASRSE